MRFIKLLSTLGLVIFVASCNAKEESETNSIVPSVSPTHEVILPPTSTPLPSPLFLGYLENEDVAHINCQVALQVSWGEGEEDWGIRDDSDMNNIHPPFIANNYFYVFDRPNRRLLKYEINGTLMEKMPVIIELPPAEKYIYGFLPWGIIATNEYLVIPYGSNSIGILSLDGEEITDLKLPFPYRYDPGFYGEYDLWIDQQGGLTVKVYEHKHHKSVYFSPEWIHDEWNEISQGVILTHPFSWAGYVGDLESAFLEIYEIGSSQNFLEKPTKEVELSFRSIAYGADDAGWVYAWAPPREDVNEYIIMRYSLVDDTKEFGILSEETIHYDLGEVVVAPDGTLYIVEYSREDVNVNPKVHSCRFSESE